MSISIAMCALCVYAHENFKCSHGELFYEYLFPLLCVCECMYVYMNTELAEAFQVFSW